MKNKFFEVLRAGISTTYQDAGRFGLQHFGVAPSGCMDLKSFKIANCLVGNHLNEGVIEFAYQGPLLKLKKAKISFAITGDVTFNIIRKNLNVESGNCYETYNLNPDDQLDIISTNKSVYGYLSVKGGFNINLFWNSYSVNTKAKIGPNNGEKFSNNQKIFLNDIKQNFQKKK